MTRKIVQVSIDTGGGYRSSVYALCDDGTLWYGSWNGDKISWNEVDTTTIYAKHRQEKINYKSDNYSPF